MAHAQVAIRAPQGSTMGRCSPCVISKAVRSAAAINHQRNTLLSVYKNSCNSLHTIIQKWNGGNRRLTANDIRRQQEREVFFEGVEWQSREGWATAEEPA